MMILYKPSLEELSFKQELLADEATMSYNHAYGGCIDFPQEKWEKWYEKWLKSNTNQYFYRYLYCEELKCFVGECAYRFDEGDSRWYCDVIVHEKYRGRGYGSEALRLLCDSAKSYGLTELYDNIAVDNPSIRLFLHSSFMEVGRSEEAILLKKIL